MIAKQQTINGKDAEPLIALNYAIDGLEAIFNVLEQNGSRPEDIEDARFFALCIVLRLKPLRDFVKGELER